MRDRRSKNKHGSKSRRRAFYRQSKLKVKTHFKTKEHNLRDLWRTFHVKQQSILIIAPKWMLMLRTDSMVTCWRLIKSPCIGKKITYANIDRKNEGTKKKATKININNSPSSITLTLPTKQLRFIRLPRINRSHCHWVFIFSQQAFSSHETVSNQSIDFPRFWKIFCLFLRASSGDVFLVRFLWGYGTLRFGCTYLRWLLHFTLYNLLLTSFNYQTPDGSSLSHFSIMIYGPKTYSWLNNLYFERAFNSLAFWCFH